MHTLQSLFQLELQDRYQWFGMSDLSPTQATSLTTSKLLDKHREDHNAVNSASMTLNIERGKSPCQHLSVRHSLSLCTKKKRQNP
jgi:hypothetical protein